MKLLQKIHNFLFSPPLKIETIDWSKCQCGGIAQCKVHMEPYEKALKRYENEFQKHADRNRSK